MQTRRLGNTGLQVSCLCLGTMTFGLQTDEARARAILDRAAKAGINFIDTADVYPLGGDTGIVGRTEEIVGRWLQAAARPSSAPAARNSWATRCAQPRCGSIRLSRHSSTS
ncbi:aldo/keto reductase [Herbaspirillum sp. SJZ107]|uniref:aldo/keto reductase n=1 Tax=Herbaspirillum sp. SJZ107 TaxID=2572881 RepID=UPI00114ED91F|nr:aldo/keto reductase [Herbaspirillum sp. SJZ107]TQK11357.1 aldo/keto reductase family protein [Herbaspirillum sp. SJZ107]